MTYVYLSKTCSEMHINRRAVSQLLKDEGYINEESLPTRKGANVGIAIDYPFDEYGNTRQWMKDGKPVMQNRPTYAKYPKEFLYEFILKNMNTIKNYHSQPLEIPTEGIEIPDYKNPGDLHPQRDNYVVAQILPITKLHEKDLIDIAEISILDAYGNELFHSLLHCDFPLYTSHFDKTGLVSNMLENQPTLEVVADHIIPLLSDKQVIVENGERFARALRSAFQLHNLNNDFVDNMNIYSLFPNITNKYRCRYKTLKWLCQEADVDIQIPQRTSYDCYSMLKLVQEKL